MEHSWFTQHFQLHPLFHPQVPNWQQQQSYEFYPAQDQSYSENMGMEYEDYSVNQNQDEYEDEYDQEDGEGDIELADYFATKVSLSHELKRQQLQKEKEDLLSQTTEKLLQKSKGSFLQEKMTQLYGKGLATIQQLESEVNLHFDQVSDTSTHKINFWPETPLRFHDKK
eukprot:TRINITY_DN14267_c0_g1_i1.p1 TRINITY_DN14267_c0_g1~~TRINITY_DN14267_c0_g1_i1.p1  ORF type:complete len:179 (-),score=41.70 TRINITY_DN14267_c0_g1_i1:125-631(-)